MIITVGIADAKAGQAEAAAAPLHPARPAEERGSFASASRERRHRLVPGISLSRFPRKPRPTRSKFPIIIINDSNSENEENSMERAGAEGTRGV